MPYASMLANFFNSNSTFGFNITLIHLIELLKCEFINGVMHCEHHPPLCHAKIAFYLPLKSRAYKWPPPPQPCPCDVIYECPLVQIPCCKAICFLRSRCFDFLGACDDDACSIGCAYSLLDFSLGASPAGGLLLLPALPRLPPELPDCCCCPATLSRGIA